MRLLDEDRMAERTVDVTRDSTWAFETAQAFDAVAGEYDRTNRENPILAHMRARALTLLRTHVCAGSDVLDIGCGPGTDHRAMLTAGYCVTAIDVSPEMVREAQRRAAVVDGPHRPVILCRSIDQLGKFAPNSFDAAFSNFGPLNCVFDLEEAARQIHAVLRPGGVLVASVIGRICPWEVGLYLSRGNVRRAFVRFGRGMVRVPLKSGQVWTRYFTPGHFGRVFARAGFRRLELRGLGVVAPPPYLESFAARRPHVVSRLLRADEVVGGWPMLRAVGDHFLIVLGRD